MPDVQPGDATDAHSPFSPAEESVLHFLREKRFDAEIAVRLGMTVGQLKARVEEMQRRAGVHTRADLLAWTPGPPHDVPADVPAPASSGLPPGMPLEPPPPLELRPVPRLRGALIATGALGVVAGGVVGWFAATARPASPEALPAVEPAAGTAAQIEAPTVKAEYSREMNVSFSRPSDLLLTIGMRGFTADGEQIDSPAD